MTFGPPLCRTIIDASLRRGLCCCTILFVLLPEAGCQQDYNPSWEYADTPSTLPIEQENTLIDNGEIMLKQLDMDGLSDIGAASQSIDQLNKERQSAQEAKQFVPDDIPDQPWIDIKKLPVERWENYYLKNRSVGYIRRDFQKSSIGDTDRVVVKSTSEIRRGTTEGAIVSKAQLLVVESLRGEFKSLDGTISLGTATKKVEAVVTLDTLTIKTVRDGRRNERTIPSDPHLRGPFATEESLLQVPMKQGEVRKMLMFDPSVADVVQVELIGRGTSRVPVSSGEFLNLFEIEQRVYFGKDTYITSLWTDDAGEIKKRYLGAAGLTSNQVSEEMGMAVLDAAKLKALPKKAVPLASAIDIGKDVQKLSFRASSTRSDPFNYFASDSWQLLHSISPMVIDIDVTGVDVRQSLQQPEEAAPVEGVYLASSYFIDATDPTVSKLASQWVESENELPTVLKIASGVHKQFEIAPFECNISKASETAISKKTDSLGAAILMCAAARSVHIPARVGYGLTYNKKENGQEMRFHAWTEVYHAGKWLPIDCSQPDFQIPLATLKLFDSPMDSQNAVATVLKAFEAVQSLELSTRPN